LKVDLLISLNTEDIAMHFNCIKLYQGRILSQSESIKWISLTLVSARSMASAENFPGGQKECLTGRNFPWGGGKLFSNQEIPKICTLIFQKMAKKHDFYHIFSQKSWFWKSRGGTPPPYPTRPPADAMAQSKTRTKIEIKLYSNI